MVLYIVRSMCNSACTPVMEDLLPPACPGAPVFHSDLPNMHSHDYKNTIGAEMVYCKIRKFSGDNFSLISFFTIEWQCLLYYYRSKNVSIL